MRALVQDKGATAFVGAPSALPGGAALLTGTEAWVLIDDGEVSRFGPALAWAVRHGATALSVLVSGSDIGAGVIARRASAFSYPINVYTVSGRTQAPATPSAPLDPGSGEPPADLVELLSTAGLEVVWEHGVLRGEVLGLEVARTVGDHLEVGVGRHDRMAWVEFQTPVPAALESAVAAVRDLRRPGAPAHPANRLARSRWLRSVVASAPLAYGFESLVPVAPPLPWFDLPDAGPAPAIGADSDGRPVVVVCSVGIDLDLLPTAADCRLLYGPASELVLLLPAGDDLPITRTLAELLERPPRVQTVDRKWRS
ncbi:MAG TPA: hypothetical protein VG435_03215 [Acidimicrobiales bacterium]|nr:hypothetical protein [Acidimicrobiales bacterium]